MYTDRLVNYIFRFVKDKETAKELTQDVFLKLWVHRSAIDESLSFEAWLFTIARNHLFNYLKRQLREQQAYKEIGKEISVPPDDFSYQETLHSYLNTLDKLPVQQKKVFLLSREAGLSYRQIAGELGISISAVEKHMMAALRTLREKMHPAYLLLLVALLYN